MSYYSQYSTMFFLPETAVRSHYFFLCLSHWLDRHVTPLRLCLTIGVAVLLQLAMMPLDRHLHLVSGGLSKPSLVFGSSADLLREHLYSFGAEGRRTLARLYAIDLVFPTALALASIQSAWLAFRRALPDVALLLAGIALAFDLLDLLEKLLSFVILARFPLIETGWMSFAVAITSIKLICLAVVYVGMIAAFVAWVMSWCKKPRMRSQRG